MSFRQVTLGRISCAIIALVAVSLMGRMAFAAEPAGDLVKPAGEPEAAPITRSVDDASQAIKTTDTVPAKPRQTTPSRPDGPISSNGIRLYRYGRATQIYGVH